MAHEVTTPTTNCIAFDGSSTLAILPGDDEGRAEYQWTSGDGSKSATGTLERSPWVEPDDALMWPTHLDQAPSTFYTLLGACVAGGPGCPPDWRLPDWTACSAELCLAGAGDSVDVYDTDGYDYLFTVPPSSRSAAISLMLTGWTDVEALEILG